MTDLTSRQTQILKLIRDTIERTGLPPTRGEICKLMGFRSPNAAEQHLRALEQKGVIELVPGTSRGIRLLAQGMLTPEYTLPVVGRVAAGQPILAAEHIEDHLRVDRALFHPRADYLLRVRGMSMRDAGILDGDLLAVRRARQADNGQIVVARIDGDEVTVKFFHKAHYRVQLRPANREFSVIEIDLREREFAIEGVMAGLVRQEQRSRMK
ncbi:MAG: transcriptional repressor LexA [Gammaproteobacteria bacterium]|nr:transcriptional repressor LexA [Gammaproteobacteria bacterium]